MGMIISIFAIFGLAFAIKETDGPWNIVSRWRNWMMRLPLVGVQFYNLLQCYYCTGFWSGIIIYLMTQENYKITFMICWGLASGAICLIMDGVLSHLQHKQ